MFVIDSKRVISLVPIGFDKEFDKFWLEFVFEEL